jgi:drug/metabolite transporter (DMT)-like permease
LSPLDTSSDRHTGRGLLLVAAAAVIWSFGGLFVRSLETTDPWVTIFWRSLFASLFLAGVVVSRERRATIRSILAMGRPGLVVGGCFATASIGLIIALSLTSVANTLIILSTSPLLAALLGWAILGDRIRRRTWLATSAVLIGVGIMVSGSASSGSLAGDLVAGVTPIAFAFATVTIRQHRDIGMTPAMLIGTLLALIVAAPLTESFAVSGSDMALLAAFGSVQLGLGMALYVAGARLAPPADATLISLIETVLGPIWVWIVVGERVGAAGLIGGSIVLVAMIAHSALDLSRWYAVPTIG